MLTARHLGLVVVLAVSSVLLSAQQSNAPISFFYDSLGRLSRVVDNNGNVATYNYDAVGNIISISRSTTSTSALSILSFTPQQGSTGQTVTLQGQGFSTTPSANNVQFNGTTAVVSAATATSLTVTVPASATTGPISVTVGPQTTSSTTNFSVVPATLVSIQVSPSTASVAVGGTQQFTATANYNNGTQQNVTALATWNASNAAGSCPSCPPTATVSNAPGSHGLVTATNGGGASISATYGGFTGFASVKIITFTSFAISPVSPSISAGTVLQFTSSGNFSDGSSQNLTSQSVWSSNQTSVATISNSPGTPGLATGVGAGFDQICASYNNNQQQACTVLTVVLGPPVSIVVSPTNLSIPKAVQQSFTALATYANNSTQDLTTQVIWTSSNPAVATISNSPGSQGLVMDVGSGTATITATSGTIRGSTTLTLTPAVPVKLTVSPVASALQVGSTLQLTATLVFTDSSTQDVTQSATWSSSAASSATISNAAGSQGLVTGVAVGSATITATSGSFAGSSSILVNSATAPSYSRFLYTSEGGGSVYIYSVNSQTGQLRANGSVQVSNQSGNLALDPSQNYLFLSVPATAGNFLAFAVNQANGALTQVPGSPYTAGTSDGPVAAEPSGRFVYVGDPTTNTIFGFSIGSNGALTALPGSPYPANGQPKAFLVHPTGKYLFAIYNAQNAVGSVAVFAIDANTGALAPVAGSPFSTAYSSVALAQDPAGKFLYVSNTGQNFGSWLRPLQSPNHIETSVRWPSLASRNDLLLADLDLTGTSPFADKDLNGGPFVLAPRLTLLPQSGVTTAPVISAFTVDANSGTLTEIPGSPFPVSTGPQSISVDTTGQYLYGSTGLSVLGFSINGTSGALTTLSVSPFHVSTSSPIDFSSSGQFAYVAAGSGVQLLGTNSTTGMLTALPGGGPVGGSSIAISLASVPISYVPQSAYVVSSGATNGANSIAGYSIDPVAGGLTALAGSPFAEGFFPMAAITDMFGQSLYVANTCSDLACAQSNGSVSGYAIDPTSGILTAFGSPSPAGVGTVSVALQPPGAYAQSSTEYAYAATQNGQIFEYTVTPATGVLTTFQGSPAYTTANGVIATAVDPTGSFLYEISKCPTCTNGTFYVYDLFLYQGQLIYQPAAISTQIGTAPTSIGVDPGGRYVFITDGVANQVSVYAVATDFSLVAGSPFATDGNPSAVALDPWGQFVYIANQATNDVSAYTLNPSTGALTPITGSPYPVGAGPVSLSVDFSGKFLYVTNNGAGTVSAFSIASGTGALTPIAGSPFPTGAVPISIVTTGKIQ